MIVAHSEEDMEAIEAASEADDDAAANAGVSFLQLRQPRALLSQLASKTAAKSSDAPDQDRRAQVLALLRSESQTLKSTLLADLASRVAADPFAKIKKLIQELIERLLQEAADEANHKGWCDKEMSAAKQARTYQAENIAKLNARLATAEATRDKLTEEIQVLDKEIKELEDELAAATKMRADEKAENEATIKEAEEGEEAVSMAIDILSKFYKTAAKAKGGDAITKAEAEEEGGEEPPKEGLVQKGVVVEAPDAGFDSGEAYKGKGAESGGILGMLDVILSDFKRTIRETTKAEAIAQQEFLEFERETKISLTEKNTARDAKQEHLTKTLDAIAEDKASMESAQDMLNKAIKELMELYDACIDTGMSYAERVALREQEIEALKKALCILDTMGPVQTEGC